MPIDVVVGIIMYSVHTWIPCLAICYFSCSSSRHAWYRHICMHPVTGSLCECWLSAHSSVRGGWSRIVGATDFAKMILLVCM